MTVSFSITMRMRDYFFDSPEVIDFVAAANRLALAEAGAFIRRSARSILRRRKRVSRPGEPPSVHSNLPQATLKNILFVYDRRSESMVVGPVALNQRNDDWIAGFGHNITIPQLMEFGGVLSILEKSADKGLSWRRQDRRRNPREWEIFRRRRAIYKPRPFMGPALDAEKDHIPDAWSGSMGG